MEAQLDSFQERIPKLVPVATHRRIERSASNSGFGVTPEAIAKRLESNLPQRLSYMVQSPY
jgi:hypothetical protein